MRQWVGRKQKMAKITSWKDKKARVFGELVAILGEENVSENLAVRAGYRLAGRLSPLGKPPKIVALPRTVEHVQQIVKLANKENVSILPICGGSSTRSSDADILLDMMMMDKILKIDPENSYVLVEPGVTFAHLDPILRKLNYVIPRGSNPMTVSAAGNLAVNRSVDNNFSGRRGDQALGVEVVLFDGTILRTGLAALGTDYWQYSSKEVPDLKGIFMNAATHAPILGIITKAAIRIWPAMEARAVPIAGFEEFENTFKYCKVLVDAGIVDQTTIWNWVLVGMTDRRAGERGGQDDLDFLNYRMKAGYTEPYRGLRTYYAMASCRGFKEQVEVYEKLCERIAREQGGKVLSEEELQNTIPHCAKLVRLWWKDYNFGDQKEKAQHMWSIGGEGQADSWYIQGWVDDLIKVEKVFAPRLMEKYGFLAAPLICRVYETGQGGHLRYVPGSDVLDDFQIKRHAKIRKEMNDWVKENFPNVQPTSGSMHIDTFPNPMIDVLNKIRDVLDPNHIGYKAGEARLEPEVEDEEKATGTAAATA
mgnify:CR=1 FL=1